MPTGVGRPISPQHLDPLRETASTRRFPTNAPLALRWGTAKTPGCLASLWLVLPGFKAAPHSAPVDHRVPNKPYVGSSSLLKPPGSPAGGARISSGLPTRTLSCSNGLHSGRALVGLPRLQQTRLAEYGFYLSPC